MLENFGNFEVIIAPINEENLEISTEKGRKYTSTAICPRLKEVFGSMVNNFSTEVDNAVKASGVKEVELEFSFGFSEKSNFWVIGIDGNQSFKVKMKWSK